MNTISKFDSYVVHSYGRYPLVMETGSKRTCTNEDNMEYIDFGSGIGTNCLGFCDEEWADAVCCQVRTLQHSSNYYYTSVQGEFAELLCERLPDVPVAMMDERMTTMVASRYLNETNTRGKKRKGVIDTLSAEIILQNTLDRLKMMS